MYNTEETFFICIKHCRYGVCSDESSFFTVMQLKIWSEHLIDQYESFPKLKKIRYNLCLLLDFLFSNLGEKGGNVEMVDGPTLRGGSGAGMPTTLVWNWVPFSFNFSFLASFFLLSSNFCLQTLVLSSRT